MVQHPQLQPAPVQVIVPQRPGNGLAIASFTCGLLAVLTCCVPIVPWLLSAFGLLFGVLAIFVAFGRGGAGLGFTFAGLALSGLAFIPILFIGGLIAAWSTNRATRASNTDNAPTVAGKGAAETKVSDVGKPQQQDDIRVTVLRAAIEKVQVSHYSDKESMDELLTIRLRIENLSGTRKHSYSGWGKSSPFLSDSVSLADYLGNRYALVHFGALARIVGQVATADIYPEKELEDLLVFERPVDAATAVLLTLPGKNAGAQSDFEFIITQADWQSPRTPVVPPRDEPTAPPKALPPPPTRP